MHLVGSLFDYDKMWNPLESTYESYGLMSLRFGRKDNKMIEDIVKNLESSKAVNDQTMKKIRAHFDGGFKKPSLTFGRSCWGAENHALRSRVAKIYQTLSLEGKSVHLNDISHLSVARGDEGWNLTGKRMHGIHKRCDLCKGIKRVSKNVDEMFRSQIYPWQSDEEDDPYLFCCPRGRAAIQRKTYSTYTVYYQFRSKYFRLVIRKKRRKRKKARKARRKRFRKTIKIRHSVRKAVRTFKIKRTRKLWDRTITKVKLFRTSERPKLKPNEEDVEFAKNLPSIRLRSIFSKTVDLKFAKNRIGLRRGGLRAVPLRSQSSMESMFETNKDPFDDQDVDDDGKPSLSAKKLKFTRTLVHSMKMSGKNPVKIGYTSEGLKIISNEEEGSTKHRETLEKERNGIIDVAEDKERRRAVLFPNMSRGDIDKKFMKICNDDPSWKKFVKSYNKIKKSGIQNLDMDTMLRGLLHPSDYRKILGQIVVEPKVTIGLVHDDETENEKDISVSTSSKKT